MTNLSTLASAPSMDLLLAEIHGHVKVTRLPRRGPRKGEAVANRVGGASTRWRNSTGGNGRLQAGQLRADEIAIKSALR